MENATWNDKSGSPPSRFNQDVYSKVVRAGKRTYFFDVKSTRQDELYLTITESKRKFETDGQPVFEKHKIFLYREDFEKFMEGMQDMLDYIVGNQPAESESNFGVNDSIEFDDLRE